MTLPEDVTTYTQILTTAFIILPGLAVWSSFRVFGGKPSRWYRSWYDARFWFASKCLGCCVWWWSNCNAIDLSCRLCKVWVLPAFLPSGLSELSLAAVRKAVPDVLDLLVKQLFVTLLVMSILDCLSDQLPRCWKLHSLNQSQFNLPFDFGGFWLRSSPINRRIRCSPHLQLRLKFNCLLLTMLTHSTLSSQPPWLLKVPRQ